MFRFLRVSFKMNEAIAPLSTETNTRYKLSTLPFISVTLIEIGYRKRGNINGFKYLTQAHSRTFCLSGENVSIILTLHMYALIHEIKSKIF